MRIQVTVTARELLDRGVWDRFCETEGLNVWAINEGLMEDTQTFLLTEEQARKLGFSPKQPDYADPWELADE